MSFVQAIVVFAVLWFLTFLMVLPIRFVSQADSGTVVPGTPRSAPAAHDVGRKAWITTGLALALTLVCYWVISSGTLTIQDLDLFNRGSPAAAGGTGG